MNVIVSNTVALNGGDAAILFAIRRVLGECFGDRLNLIVFDSQPETASRLYPELDFRQLLYHRATWGSQIDEIENRYFRFLLRKISRWINPFRVWVALYVWRWIGAQPAQVLLTEDEWNDLDAYASADIVISTGGTYLVDYYFLEPRIFDYQVTHFLDKPLVFYTQTTGPFYTPRYRRNLQSVMNRARLILLRDQESIDNLKELGVNETPLVKAADAVFSLANPNELTTAKERSFPQNGRLSVAVSVRDWPHFQTCSHEEGMQRYMESVGSAVIRLVKRHGAAVTFISTCQGVSEYRTDDSDIAFQIVNSLPKEIQESVVVDASFHAPIDLKNHLNTYDFVIATRMHMAILALTAGTPVLPIAYESKTTQLFRKMGLASWSTDIETINSSFQKHVDRFIEQIDNLRDQMMHGTEQERREAKVAAKQLIKIVHEIEMPMKNTAHR